MNAISARFNLPGHNRHPASGDAKLLMKFFEYLNLNIEKGILKNAITQSIKEHSLPVYLPKDIISTVPTSMGVYMFYGENKSLLYIGKSKSLVIAFCLIFLPTIYLEKRCDYRNKLEILSG